MAETLVDGGGEGGTAVAVASDFPDDIRALGERLAGLGLEAGPLRAYLADEHGIEGPAGIDFVAAVPHDGGTTVLEEATHFDVVLTGFDAAKKMAVIKEVRAVTAFGLAESKAVVEGCTAKAFTLKDAVPKADAETLKKKLEEIGAKIELK